VANGKKAGSALRFNVTSVVCGARKTGPCSGFAGVIDAIHVTFIQAGDKVGLRGRVAVSCARKIALSSVGVEITDKAP
jgi:hypothetical protein